MLGTISSFDRGEVTIHTYTSPESGLEANTHIVELPNQLLVIDTQYAVPFAAEAAAYAATLNKPITHVFITHAHPDHFFGAAEFSAPVYALAGTKSAIETNGETILSNNRATAGDVLPAKVTVPTEVVTPGETVIDGIRLEFSEFTDGEAGTALVIALPDQDVLIAQDLVYNNLHLFIAEGHLDHWLAIVDELRQRGFGTIVPGHGAASGPEVFDFVESYLRTAKPILAEATSPEELSERLIAAFPDVEGRGLLAIQNSYLFPQN
ncbi:MBL fold metallo-hydrolase [Corynebacterium durum]|uniref:MBL fold metallo-hydrolase n=1 Tax=Corynebacterium durum TaxID=61592 RepID=UPI004028339A